MKKGGHDEKKRGKGEREGEESWRWTSAVHFTLLRFTLIDLSSHFDAVASPTKMKREGGIRNREKKQRGEGKKRRDDVPPLHHVVFRQLCHRRVPRDTTRRKNQEGRGRERMRVIATTMLPFRAPSSSFFVRLHILKKVGKKGIWKGGKGEEGNAPRPPFTDLSLLLISLLRQVPEKWREASKKGGGEKKRRGEGYQPPRSATPSSSPIKRFKNYFTRH